MMHHGQPPQDSLDQADSEFLENFLADIVGELINQDMIAQIFSGFIQCFHGPGDACFWKIMFVSLAGRHGRAERLLRMQPVRVAERLPGEAGGLRKLMRGRKTENVLLWGGTAHLRNEPSHFCLQFLTLFKSSTVLQQ